MNFQKIKYYVLVFILIAGNHAFCQFFNNCNCCPGISILLFKPCENGLAYGFVATGKDILNANQFLPFPDQNFSINTKVKDPNFDYDVGFRIHDRLTKECCCWDLSFDWMHFKGHGDGKTEAKTVNGSGELFVGTWSNALFEFYENFARVPFFPGETDFLETVARARLNTHINVVDLDLGFLSCVTPCFTLRPLFGVRLAFIDQNYILKNTSVGEFDDGAEFTEVGNGSEKIKLKNDSWGYGIRTGLEGEYALKCDVSLFGKGAVSLLKNYYKIDENYSSRTLIIRDDRGDTIEFTNVITDNQKECLGLIRLHTDLIIGLRWKYCVCNAYPLTLQASWESHLYFGQNQIRNLGFAEENFGAYGIPQNNRGDLGLSGWSFSANLCF